MTRKMNKKSIFYTFIVIILCISLASAASNNLVPPICKYLSQSDPANVYYESCILTLNLDPRSFTSTAPQLAQIAFDLSISRANDIISTINTLLKSSASGPPVVGNALKDCLGVYSRIPNNLKAGLEALRGGDMDTASASASAAMNAAVTCGNGIKDSRGNIGSLIKETTDFYQLSAISLGLIKLLRIIN